MRWRNGVESVARVEKIASHYLRRTSTPRAQVREYFSRLLLPGELQPRVRISDDSILVFARGLPGRHPNVASDRICDLDPRFVGAGGHGKGTGSVRGLFFFFGS